MRLATTLSSSLVFSLFGLLALSTSTSTATTATSALPSLSSSSSSHSIDASPILPPSPHSSRSSSNRNRAAKVKRKTLQESSSSPLSPLSPLLLHPSPHTVWPAGTSQLVQWSKKYASDLPKATTVDIVLLDPITNRKLVSLKRFIPFRKGKAQIKVPTTSSGPHVLALELFLGKSPLEVAVEIEISKKAQTASSESKLSSSSSSSETTQVDQVANEGSSSSSTIVKRADIHISHVQPRVERGNNPPPAGINRDNKINNDISPGRNSQDEDVSDDDVSNGEPGLRRKTIIVPAGAHISGTPVDMYGDDYYLGSSEDRSMDFLPNEMRQEYPSVVLPLELEHTLGLYQKVYLLTPYTLEWRIPERVAELLDYTDARLRLIRRTQGRRLDREQYQAVQQTLRKNTKTYLAKLLIELVRHDTLETVSVLARNVPAETRFQYLQILDRVEPDQYRLRVQMVVVEVEDLHMAGEKEEEDDTADKLHMAASRIRSTHGDHTEGWEFPIGGRVIDRYESVTRRFWVSTGAF
ncbi:hypothetical protein EMPS_03420 [Entomortierella parvispora]|uniref:Uncharacterized protein n=1 Tax=Entomortierella parvispora TaxID=205924 RepID=A0A9P3H6K2_9FUNG|nr:hypothetical protein EMPS_03420 [Entomortierella parvispora]